MTLRRIQRGDNRPIADENIDLRFRAGQGKRILDELAEARSERAEIRAEQKNLAEVVGRSPTP